MDKLTIISKFRVIGCLLLVVVISPHLARASGDRGLEAHLAAAVEGLRNFGGGIARGTQLLNAGFLNVSLDTERAGWWPGGTAFLEGVINHGQDPSARFIGDVQVASNIADRNRTNLHQAWYAQNLGDHASVLAGLHDLNTVFDFSDYASIFLNSSFGIGPEISVNVPASIWPRAGGAVVAQGHWGRLSARVGVYDGDPLTRAIRPGAEGLMWIGEASWADGARAYKIGAWRHTADKTGPDGRVFGSDSGAYVIVDQPLYEKDGTALGVFLQLGAAQSDRNDIASYVGAGLHLDGPFPGRRQDSFGVALARAGFSSVARRINGWTRDETAIEVTYDMALTEWLHLHPSFQYIRHPGGDPRLSAAKVGMLRVRVDWP